jgi:hypothetical protein
MARIIHKNFGFGRRVLVGTASGAMCVALAAACSGGSDGSTGAPSASENDKLEASIGPEGGSLVGLPGTSLEGLSLVIPPGALAQKTTISVEPAADTTPLPSTATRCGPQFSISPAGLTLAAPATLTLPFDESTVNDNDRFDDEVKVWALDGVNWGQVLQDDSTEGQVTISLSKLETVSPGVNPPAPGDIVHFDFKPNPKFVGCLAQFPNDPKQAPVISADVVRGSLNDGMFIRGKNFKPDIAFDLFTVQNSSLLASGQPDPNFQNFGMAWYQSDLEASEQGRIYAGLRSIFLDQIFGFDPAANLPPTGTFEVGFWFNDPNAAASCGFDVTKPTPFNGEHKAGPLAMITTPNASTGLGPLCTKPDTSVTPAVCDP